METMKNKKQGIFHLALIICNILLLSLTLLVTRTAIDDFENVIYQQRNHYKTYAITEMAQSYYNSEAYKKDNGEGLAKFLTVSLHQEIDEAGILCTWDPSKGFPLLYVGGNTAFQKYAGCESFKKGIELSDSLGITPLEENLKVYDAIVSCQTTSDKKPLIVKRGDGTKFLVTWVIIPSPNPKIAKYVFIVYSPTEHMDLLVEDTRVKYIWLFSSATLLAGMVLILIPIALTNNKKE